MEEQQRQDNNVKKHLASLHRKIQHKYIEMQKRLEKSKSVDNISSLSDEFRHKDFTYGSMSDLTESDEVFLSEVIETQSSVIENIHIHRQDSTTRDVEYIEASFAEAEITRNTSEEWEKINNDVVEIRTHASLESLNEPGSDDSSRHTPSPRPMTIRQRFFAARDRRREEKEKQNEKKKEKMEKLILSNTKQDGLRTHRKNKLATVTIALIEATGLENLSDGKERLLYCRFRLGSEKGKSKVVRSSGCEVKWQELFNINLFDDHMLELACFDKQIFLGRHVLNLLELEKEKTHKLRLDLYAGEISGVKIFVLLTISGISLLNSVVEIDDFENMQKRMILRKSKNDVGSHSVIVFGAKGLIAQDCYCVVKLGNERLQTHTEYKTHDPNWMKIFTFNVADITSILEIIVIEEKKSEEIGKISIPLLRIHNGETVWYALKDSTQRYRARGNNPRILLEMRTSWNLLKASIRVINPKEVDFLESDLKLDRRVFARNLSRSKAVIKWTLNALRVIKTCFEWESRKWNAIALIIWIVFCYFFKIWMLPLLLLIPFVHYRPKNYYSINWNKFTWSNSTSNQIVKIEKEEKSTLRQKINTLTEMIQSVQNGIGKVASFGESVKNLFNCTVPFVSLLAAFFIVIISFFMFVVPLKYILIGWGIHKFTRKILRPNRIPNSEILDLLSRVPDDETLLDCAELPLELEAEEEEIQRQ